MRFVPHSTLSTFSLFPHCQGVQTERVEFIDHPCDKSSDSALCSNGQQQRPAQSTASQDPPQASSCSTVDDVAYNGPELDQSLETCTQRIHFTLPPRDTLKSVGVCLMYPTSWCWTILVSVSA